MCPPYSPLANLTAISTASRVNPIAKASLNKKSNNVINNLPILDLLKLSFRCRQI